MQFAPIFSSLKILFSFFFNAVIDVIFNVEFFALFRVTLVACIGVYYELSVSFAAAVIANEKKSSQKWFS
jgi:uncharacterized membrane protein YjjB (DUF3815 family)